jgi:(p)ppGpp synthase/HD superfamily hydrolase
MSGSPEAVHVTLARAYALAARAHADQVRKGERGIPYINHCAEVALLVAEAGAPPETVVAAVLHDVIEDSETTEAEIRAAFGEAVAARVAGMTNAPEWGDLPRPEMKARQAKHMKSAEPEVKRIKIADQTSNLRDIVREPGAWDAASATEYVEGAERVVAACRGVDARLEAAFDTAMAEAMAKIGGME